MRCEHTTKHSYGTSSTIFHTKAKINIEGFYLPPCLSLLGVTGFHVPSLLIQISRYILDH